jgi:hypothetical protein
MHVRKEILKASLSFVMSVDPEVSQRPNNSKYINLFLQLKILLSFRYITTCTVNHPSFTVSLLPSIAPLSPTLFLYRNYFRFCPSIRLRLGLLWIGRYEVWRFYSLLNALEWYKIYISNSMTIMLGVVLTSLSLRYCEFHKIFTHIWRQYFSRPLVYTVCQSAIFLTFINAITICIFYLPKFAK